MPDVDEDHWSIRAGAGLLADPAMRSAMSPERWALEEAAAQREREQADQEAAEKAADVSEAAFLATMRGEVRHSALERIAEIVAEGERQDRREAAKRHVPDCGCSECGIKQAGSGYRPPVRRPAAVVQAELDADAKAFMESPASMADVSFQTGKLAHKLDWLVGKVTGKK